MQTSKNIQLVQDDIRYLQLLSNNFPNISSVSTEIINLEAILHLPKGTEHFLADIHGESEAFHHVLKNASGNIKRKVNEIFGTTLREQEKRDLCTLIYYPEKKLEIVKAEDSNINDFYQITLNQLVKICQDVSSKYTRSKVRKCLPKEFAYIIEELLHESSEDLNKQGYFSVIINTIISTGRADDFIVAICNLIQRLAIDQLHILGDIFDRGSGAHLIMDTLCHYTNFDIQWGNHDVLWMGAAAGNLCCIANVIRLSLRYGNSQTLEDGYGINMVPLVTFALEHYADDQCKAFEPILFDEHHDITKKTQRLIAQMHKAICIIQFKLEDGLKKKYSEWGMENRLVLSNIDLSRQVYSLDGQDYKLTDTNLPTVSTSNPCRLTAEEAELINKLAHSFRISDKLQNHIRCLLSHGSMYGIYNSNLLYHASIPMNSDGSFKDVEICGEKYKGKALLNRISNLIRSAFDADTNEDERIFAVDYFWYLWSGQNSPLFDKSKMATFERYFLDDSSTYAEEKGWYYRLRDNEAVCNSILDEFEVKGQHRHIINGHVPVRVGCGEKPIKAGGRLMVIDGGFAKSYHDTTGIAGYTLVYHSRGFQLVQHEPFTSTDEAIRSGTDIKSTTQIVEMTGKRIMVSDTDKGDELRIQIKDLQKLLIAYRKGLIKFSKE